MRDNDSGFSEIVKLMTEVNHSNRKNSIRHRDEMSVCEYAESFCTIHCDIGRRSGKTRYIVANAVKGDLIVVPHKAFSDNLRVAVNNGVDVLTVLQMETGDPAINQDYNNIFVDEPSLVFARILRGEFYYKLSRRDIDQTFYLLGE